MEDTYHTEMAFKISYKFLHSVLVTCPSLMHKYFMAIKIHSEDKASEKPQNVQNCVSFGYIIVQWQLTRSPD